MLETQTQKQNIEIFVDYQIFVHNEIQMYHLERSGESYLERCGHSISKKRN